MILKDFNPTSFLNQHWQQQPAVLTQFMPHFNDLIDEHDLAGIAQESDADSRIVSRNNKDEWTTTSGPFEDFNAVCIDTWSLLVQGVERYIDSVDDLFERFAFVPYWRMDDVMVSYSTEGAGVGAHIDQYDVFLIQGKGQRRWQIGKPGNYEETDNSGLRQIKGFKPVIDVITRTGDVIYIPPGWPHKGETIENSLTYSIGFRAPDTEQLVNVMHEALDTTANLNRRFSDPQRQPLTQPAMIPTTDIDKLKSMLTNMIGSRDFDRQLLSMLSDCHSIDPHSAQSVNIDEVKSALLEGCSVTRIEGIRPLYSERQDDPDLFSFHISGEVFHCDATIRHYIEPILNNRNTSLQCNDDNSLESLSRTLTQLINSGILFID